MTTLKQLAKENAKLREQIGTLAGTVGRLETFIHAFWMDEDTMDISEALVVKLARLVCTMEEQPFFNQVIENAGKVKTRSDCTGFINVIRKNYNTAGEAFDTLYELIVTLKETFPEAGSDPEMPFAPEHPILFRMLHNLRADKTYNMITKSMAAMIKAIDKLPPKFRNYKRTKSTEMTLWSEYMDMMVDTLSGPEPTLDSLLVNLNEDNYGAVGLLGRLSAYGLDRKRMKQEYDHATQRYLFGTAKYSSMDEWNDKYGKKPDEGFTDKALMEMRAFWHEFENMDKNGAFEFENPEAEIKRQADLITNKIKEERNMKQRILHFPIQKTKNTR
jgi:hypothetical protein